MGLCQLRPHHNSPFDTAAAPLPDFSLTQHIPRDLQTQDRRRTSTDRPNDYLLESQHSAPKESLEGVGEEPGVPARLRGGAPSPPATPPHLDEFGVSAESPSPRGGQATPPKSPPVSSRVASLHAESSPRFNGFESLYNVDRGVQIPLSETPPPQHHGRESLVPSLEGSPHSKRIHVSPPPRTLTPPLPPTPGSSRPPQSPTGAADISNGNRSKKVPLSSILSYSYVCRSWLCFYLGLLQLVDALNFEVLP